METKEIKDFISYLSKQPKGFAYVGINAKQQKIEELKNKHTNCQKCPLSEEGRTQVVFGKGAANATLMFVGEAPGRDEDTKGEPFIGRAGKLLTKMIEAMNMTREDVYISNVAKCRPPKNRTPLPNEAQTCKKNILFKEIEIIQPKIICCLGSSAAKSLLGEETKISQIRGKFFKKNINKKIDIEIIPTFHPAYLLRNPAAKHLVWQDLKKIIAKMN